MFSRTVLLHAMQEFNNDLGAGSNEHLALARFFSVIDGIQCIIENTCFDHIGECEILNSVVRGEVSDRATRTMLARERKECP